MGWGRYLLLGDYGQQIDINETRAELEQVARQRSGQVGKDREQDEQIEALANENMDLKLCLIALVHLLVNKGVLKSDEVRAIVHAVDPVPHQGAADRQTAAERSAEDKAAAMNAAAGGESSAPADGAPDAGPPPQGRTG